VSDGLQRSFSVGWHGGLNSHTWYWSQHRGLDLASGNGWMQRGFSKFMHGRVEHQPDDHRDLSVTAEGAPLAFFV